MKLYSRCLVMFLVLSLPAKFSMAQLFEEKHYPQHYFQWPVGAKVGLVANFGELRPNHYHMGLDIRTDQKVNVPVYAAADGYVAKIKIEPFGFGRCIYINHPNGYTTLYAHLNNFNPAIEKYITTQQYLLKKWEVFVDIPAGMLPVKKGDFIAFSGSTGGSQGPHVHFEIRDTKTDKVFNPFLFGFPIADNVPPRILRLAVYDRNKSTYEQSPKIYPLKKVNGGYTVAGGKIMLHSNQVSFAINASDSYSGSNNPNGIYRAALYNNDKPVCGFEMDQVSYEETRYLNAHIDYKTKSNGGPYLQHLSRLPGYADGIYRTENGQDGVIQLEPGDPHTIRIVVSDPYGNQSSLQFVVETDGSEHVGPSTLEGQQFFPGTMNIFENSKVRFFLPETAIYDSFHFVYKEMQGPAGHPVFLLQGNEVPVHNYFPVFIREDFSPADSGHIVMRRFFGSKEDYKKADNVNGWYKSSFKQFGYFQLEVDHSPPVIRPVGFRNGMHVAANGRIVLLVTDNTKEDIKFTALLDGNWLRFSNDKGKVFVYQVDEHCGPGTHRLKVIAEDIAGNTTEQEFSFYR